MIRILFGILVWFAAATPASAVTKEELSNLLLALEKAPKQRVNYYEGKRHIRASFKVKAVEYHVDLVHAWTVRNPPPRSLQAIFVTTLVIQRLESGPRTFRQDMYIDYHGDGVVDYASGVHQPPFDRRPPKDFEYATRLANCIRSIFDCRATGGEWKKVAQAQFDALVREILARLAKPDELEPSS